MRAIIHKLILFTLLTAGGSYYVDRHVDASAELDNELVLNAERREIWPYLQQFDKWPQWFVGLKHIVPASSNHAYKRARFDCGLEFMGDVRELRGQVLDVDHRSMLVRLDGKGFHITQRFQLDELDGAVRLSQRWTVEYTNLFYKLISPGLNATAKTLMRGNAAQLAARLREQRSPRLTAVR